ncbi:MAG: lycopene cyclase domain-containing protein [Candidatus Burarchaeum sp.]|nr:lycopene cyclase domain-containing protein [Candidatus Burarchaeum sp.]MDO8340187.1 lycopene cyclase domain-containing protein [Candidatus Burarchaeum sp.]
MIEWLVFSLVLLGIWLVLYLAKPMLRKEMLWASILTTPLGLTEPIFVPKYWTPPSLFDLTAKTGFDIESLIFCFAIGGIAAVLYEAVFKVKHKHMSDAEMHSPRHRFHKLAIISPVLVFIPLFLLTDINPIYTASIALLVGGVATWLCRPDLKDNMLIGAGLFTGLYFVFFLFINALVPEFIHSWNLTAISGVLIAGVPLEELMFAFTFGLMWSSIYEHVLWHKLG